MTRTKLRDRQLPAYTHSEEIFHMVSHIVGGAFGILALITCVIVSAFHQDVWAIVGSAIYGTSMILLYTVSSIYHALHINMGKKVMQIIDHCTIYLLIAGTYTPILFCKIRETSPIWAWTIFGIVWGLAAIAATLTAIDLKKYSKFSMICYIGMGWCIVIAPHIAIQSIAAEGLLWLLAGGIAYTIGAVIYGIGKHKQMKYAHAIFHLFVVLGSVLQYICILFYIL